MSSIGILMRECRAEITKSARVPSFAFPTIVLPVAFYSLFGLALASSVEASRYLLATFGVFAAIGPAVFGFGVGVASEREQGLLALKSVSPMPALVYPLAKLFMTIFFTAIVVLLIYAVAAFGGGVKLPTQTWATLFTLHMLAVVPFALIGLSLGYAFKGQAAVAIANIIFFVLSIVGGLWMPLRMLPDWMHPIANMLPSFHLGEIALATAGMGDPTALAAHVSIVVAWTIGLLALVIFAVRRAEA